MKKMMVAKSLLLNKTCNNCVYYLNKLCCNWAIEKTPKNHICVYWLYKDGYK